ncbi:MAG: ABC transporter ATP-binding protein [Promethearchaeota archaeon]
MPSIKLENVSLTLGGNKIIDDLTLSIESGEYFSLVGETGAGKTSILNLISGLLKPDSGRVLVDGKDITCVPVEDRDIGQVFENYALFPHYSVFKNVVYSHRVRDLDPEVAKQSARALLNTVLIKGRDDSLPAELSGGMQQRVALARALMNNSGILLLDDPLSALDAGLRMDLRIELKRLSRELKTTIIHCTNDIEEAMIVGDRMAIIKDGKIEQVGKPDEIYNDPSNLYVAAFLGDVNLFPCKIAVMERERGFCTIVHEKNNLSREFRVSIKPNCPFNENDTVILCVRAEHFHMHEGHRKKPNRIKGIIDEVSFLGHVIRYEIIDEFGEMIKVQRFVNEKTRHKKYYKGENITINFHHARAFLFHHPGDKQLVYYQNI